MSRTTSMLGGVGLGALFMYFFDPQEGRRRRALLRDQVAHLGHRIGEGSQAAEDDFGHRLRGLIADIGERFRSAPTDDTVLMERVRAKIGRLSCHPGAIFVVADNGCITLTGPILRDEVIRVVEGISQVHGVRGVINNLQIHDQPGDIPGLQGECHPAGEPFRFLERPWSPTLRFAAILAGALLGVSSLTRRSYASLPLGLGGIALILRGVSNVSLRRLFGIGEKPMAFEVHKIIDVPASVGEIYQFFAHPENFPMFMGHVSAVTTIAPNRHSWTVRGPVGMPISFQTVVTEDVPNQEIGWRSVHGALVPQTGRVLLQATPTGGTRVDLRICYHPPAGELGRMVADLFGVSPKQALDDDMVRFKSLIVSGKTTTHHGGTVSRQQVVQADQSGPGITPTQ